MVLTPEEIQKKTAQINKAAELLQSFANQLNLYARGTWPLWHGGIYKLTEADKRRLESQVMVKTKVALRNAIKKI